MIVAKDKIVSFDYTLKDSEGIVLDSSEGREPLAYLHGADNIIPGLEDALSGKSSGDQVSAVIEPENAYGPRDDALVGKVPKENLEGVEDIQIGLQLQVQTPSGSKVVHVTHIDEETVTIDANHPLAGVTLHFDVTVTEVRDATAEEVEHGHAHGPGGEHH
ncbi:MAG: peptidylprolyl isomerase [Gammaproteobacteria bacterium]|nr:peptidylprolyl isomerase [Gammaproteobacteria bacterium]